MRAARALDDPPEAAGSAVNSNDSGEQAADTMAVDESLARALDIAMEHSTGAALYWIDLNAG